MASRRSTKNSKVLWTCPHWFRLSWTLSYHGQKQSRQDLLFQMCHQENNSAHRMGFSRHNKGVYGQLHPKGIHLSWPQNGLVSGIPPQAFRSFLVLYISFQLSRRISQYGSMNGGIHTDLRPTYYHQQYSKASTATSSKLRDYITSKQFSSTRNSKYHGFSAGVTKSFSTTILQINFQWAYSENTKSSGGTNSIGTYAQKQQSVNSSPQAKNFNIRSIKFLTKQTLQKLPNPLIRLQQQSKKIPTLKTNSSNS